MRRRSLWLAALGAAAVLSSLLYALWAGGQINGPLGLDRFDESLVRSRVMATAQRLLDEPGRLEVRLSQKTDTQTLRRMQQLVGFRAANYWARKEIPIQRWIYKVYLPHSLTSWRNLREPDPELTAEVDSTGQILALKIPPRKWEAAQKLTADKALQIAQDALRFVGADVGRLALTSTVQGEAEGRQTFDFAWKQPVEGFPGLLYQYSVNLQGGFLTSLKRDVIFSEESAADPLQDLVLPLLWGAAWFFLALLVLLLFIQRLRRDEIDIPHAQKVGLVAGVLTFLRSATHPEGGILVTFLAAAVLSLLAALFFGFLWAVAESMLRDQFSDRLRSADLLFHGNWRVRELGRTLLGSSFAGLLLLLVPVLLLLGALFTPLRLVILPSDLSLGNLRFPGGLVANALLGPAALPALLTLVFLGVAYPVLRLRLSRLKAGALFCLLFSFAVANVLPVGPPLLALLLAFGTGAVAFAAMEFGGLLTAFLVLYPPLVIHNLVLLLTSPDLPVKAQGWIGLAVLGLLGAGAAAVSVTGRPAEAVENYEPEYLVRLRERERFARELEIAKGIQERFLPKVTPQIPGFSLATCCRPAMEVGGDYYDFLPLPDGRWLLLLGDVSGKGVKAAFYMTLTKGILHSISAVEGNHIEILRRLNRIFGGLTESGIFLTLCAMVLDPVTRDVLLVSAGHNPPFLTGPSGARVLEPRGLVLGVMNDEIFLKSLREVRLRLEPGEALVLYTDGVTEAMNRECQEFGMERLAAVLDRSVGKGVESLVDEVLAAVEGFQEGAHQADDLTLLVVKAHES